MPILRQRVSFYIGHWYQFSVGILSCHAGGPGSIPSQFIYLKFNVD